MSVRLYISGYFDSLVHEVDIYTEELLKQIGDYEPISPKQAISEFSYSFNSRPNKVRKEQSADPYSHEYTYEQENTDLIERPRKKIKLSIKDQINEHRTKVISVIRMAEKESYEHYNSIKSQVTFNAIDDTTKAKIDNLYGQIFAEKFYFVLGIDKNWNGLISKEESNFNLVIILSDFYLSQDDLNLLKFLLFGNSPNSAKLNICFDQKTLLISMLKQYILGIFQSRQFVDFIITVNKAKLLSIEKVRFSEEIDKVNLNKDDKTLDFSSLKSLELANCYRTLLWVNADLNALRNLKILSLSHFQIEVDSLKDLSQLSKLKFDSCLLDLSVLSSFPELEELEIKSTKMRNFNLDTSLYLNRLKSFTISATFELDSDSLIQFIRSLFDRLVMLRLKTPYLNDSILESLFKNVTNSSIECIHINSDKFLSPITSFLPNVGFDNLKEFLVYSYYSNVSLYMNLFSNLPPNLERLNLSYSSFNNFEKIPKLNNLKFLNLRGNSSKEINYQAFKHLNKLEDLNLSRIKISSSNLTLYPNSFYGLENLLKLNLSENDLRSIDPSIFTRLPKLEDLNLSMNQIELASRQFASLTHLKKLNLSSNQLKTIDREEVFANLVNLRELILCTNYLKELKYEWFEGLKLAYLNFNDNFLEWNNFNLDTLAKIRENVEKIELLGNFAGERIGNLRPVFKYLKTDGFDLSTNYKDYYTD